MVSSVREEFVVLVRLLNLSKLASGSHGHVGVLSLSELIVFFLITLLWVSHYQWQLIGCHDHWYSFPSWFRVSGLPLGHHALALKEKLGSLVLIPGIKEPTETAFLTDDESRGSLTSLVSAVKIASCLHVVNNIEDFAESIEELSLASIGSPVDNDAI